MRTVITLLLGLLLSSCSKKPTFEDLVNNYQLNSNVFNELSALACKLAKSARIERYTPRKNNQESSTELDQLLAKVSGKYIEYRIGNDSQCTLEVLVYAEGFAGVGQKFSYTYQVQPSKLFNKKIHTYDKIIAARDNTTFDMPLIANDKFTGWYFNFTYNHKF
ncbi:hypothetical protein [Psychrosphaera haliotis]|uniref:Lipoprotein n=1 Tax=Psychrosphaera haliotis TaxID=555083 RepID=A0A6N8F5Z9_9GAMM|nr:hypothetical protein [Psychrosphaera haliotis]MUH71628.1 hypothetical protein [Psychrosphaera haliotis]